MKLNLPRPRTFWTSVGIAAFSVILYIVHVIALWLPYMGLLGYLFLLAAFVLLILDITIKVP